MQVVHSWRLASEAVSDENLVNCCVAKTNMPADTVSFVIRAIRSPPVVGSVVSNNSSSI